MKNYLITFNPIKESLNVLTKISVAHFSRLLKNMVFSFSKEKVLDYLKQKKILHRTGLFFRP